jgi:hypothetical protein
VAQRGEKAPQYEGQQYEDQCDDYQVMNNYHF